VQRAATGQAQEFTSLHGLVELLKAMLAKSERR
jgi:hypothetical protein